MAATEICAAVLKAHGIEDVSREDAQLMAQGIYQSA
jgi:hypothetical protein